MKKGLVFAIFLLVTAGLFGQNTFKYEVRVPSLRVGGATKVKVDSVTVSGDTIKFFTGATELLPKGYGTGGSMTYPGSGIALSTGSAWDTSITNNSANWNTAYGWGDHSGLYLPITGTAAAVTGFTPASGSLTLSGADAVTLTTTAATNVTLPTSGTLATTANVSDSLDERIGAGSSLSELAPLLADTIPLFVFGAGGGNAADTASFTTSTLYGAFYNGGSDTLKITEFRVAMIAGSTPLGTDTLAVQVYWNDSINVTTGASVTTLNSAVLGCNSTTTGTSYTSFANSKIPPNVWVFMKSPGVVTGRKPSMVVATLMGYKIPKY